jgi:murein DD-endopeptidase MepM/ murein hydrolase activator NlpD
MLFQKDTGGLMKKALLAAFSIVIVLVIIRGNLNVTNKSQECTSEQKRNVEINGTIKNGETFFDIFKKYGLSINELFKLREASADVHKLRKLYPGRPYRISLDMNNHVDSFVYWINDDSILNIKRTESGFSAEKITIEYEKRICHIGGLLKDNLISSIGEDRENVMLALQLSDIFAWDIDFTTDLRNDDTFRIIVEGFYLNGEFKKYGEILSAEFVNDGETYRAYRFERDGRYDYYDDEGKSLKRSFLKAPLNFRRISSSFSQKRFHPILRIYRPHLGVDYAASAGTPVSVVGDGTVVFAGYKGQNGNIVIIRHYNGYRTYYGHLSKIVKGIRKGVKVRQGQILGYVGATGLATGPHLDYRIQVNKRFVNPLTLKLPRGESIPNNLIAQFKSFRDGMDTGLASITLPATTLTAKRQE